MSIVKTKRLRLIGMRTEREALLRLLQHMGCVEIDELEDRQDNPDWAALSRPDTAALDQARQAKASVEAALKALKKYAPKEKGTLLQGRPAITEKQLFDEGAYAGALADAQALNVLERNIAALQTQQNKLRAQRLSLEPWLELDVPLESASTAEVQVSFGAVPSSADLDAMEAALGAAGELFQVLRAGRDAELSYFVLVCHKSQAEACQEVLKEYGFTRSALRGWTGTAAENDRRLAQELSESQKELEQAMAGAAAYAPKKAALELCLDRAEQEIFRETARSRLLDSGSAFFLEGWVPAPEAPEIERALSGYACAWELEDPTPEEYPTVPVKLKNNVVTRSMNVITEMYSLPAYDGIDPNPLMFPFFVFFFGMMMADMAYGLLMVAGALVVLVRTKPKNPAFMEMILWCGISTFIWGAMTGGFFGDFIPQLLRVINPASTFEMPALFTPLTDTIAILLGSLVLGCIQVFTGMLISVVRKIQAGDFIDALFDEITWWIILAGVALAVLGLGSVGGVPVLVVAGFLMLAVGGTRNAKGFGKLTSLVGLVYNGVSGFFSDILSYLRLMALMLAGSVIAQVFNTLGAVFGNVIVFVLISMVGNALNLALNLLGCYVHDLRLQCLEYFNRFYKGGGRPFKPLNIDTNYVQIMKEEQ